MRIAVIGLGKIGLPLAAQFASKGHFVVGCDISEDVVDMVNSGRSHVDNEAGLATAVLENVKTGRLVATTDTIQAVKASNVVVIIVPLMVDDEHNIDFNAIDSATTAVAQGLHKDQLIIYETTLPVGTTRNRFGKTLAKRSGLTAGEDFFLAFSPERVYSGRIFQDLRSYPKVVGGINKASTEKAINFYSDVLDADILDVGNSEASEFTKLIETTYRDVNIALANEFAQVASEHDIDVTKTIHAANTQPFSHIHRPGVGVGGHCIPVYPYFLMNGNSRESQKLKLPRLARTVNDDMPAYAIDQLASHFPTLKGKCVLILGLAYRGNVKEAAFTPARGLITTLAERGAEVYLHDPLFTNQEIESFGVTNFDFDDQIHFDALILQANHDLYKTLDYSQFKGCQIVLDGCNVLDASALEMKGITYVGIGK